MLCFLKKHYHWIIVAVALLQLLIIGGATNNYSAYHLVPVTEELEISRTAFSLTTSLRSVMGVVSTLFSGFLFSRLGFRKVATIGLIAASLSYVCYSVMSSYTMLIVGAVLHGLSSGLVATAAISRLLNVWFHKYRGTVMGCVTAATGVGSTVLGFLQAWAIEYVSWRVSFAIVAGLQLILAVLVFLLVRNSPNDVGLSPFGEGQVLNEKKKKTSVRWEGFSMQQLQKRPAYYLLILCAFLSCLCALATQYNLVPYFQDCGISATRASRIYGIMMLALGFLKLFMGVLCDTLGPKRVTVMCHIALSIGLVLVLVLPKTDVLMIGALLVIDLALPLTTMIFPLLSLDLFGYQAQNQYIGVIMSMTSAGSIISGPLANAVRDMTGTYDPVFWGVAIGSVAVIGLYWLVFALVARDKKKLDAKG